MEYTWPSRNNQVAHSLDLPPFSPVRWRRRGIGVCPKKTPFFPAMGALSPECREVALHTADYVLLPPYPIGYTIVDGHVPWTFAHVVEMLVCTVFFACLRRAVRRCALFGGPRLGSALHGPAWLVDGDGAKVNWSRLADEMYFAVAHVLLVAWFAATLRFELRSWLADGDQFWACPQPALSRSLELYYLLQFAFNIESSIALGVRAVSPHSRPEAAMVTHHVSTLAVVTYSWRTGFMRVGALVALLHDVTDLPIDGIRLSQGLGLTGGLYISAATAVIAWAMLRLVAFPLYLMLPALTRTGHLVDMATIILNQRRWHAELLRVLIVLPLCVLWCLHVHWYAMLVAKIRRQVTRKRRSE